MPYIDHVDASFDHKAPGVIASPNQTQVNPRGVRATVILPCFNESNSVEKAADALRDECARRPDLTITALFVDDGSTDDTWRRISDLVRGERSINVQGLRLLRHQGKGVAQAVGIRRALPDADVIAVMDADGQHDFARVASLVERCIEADAPVIARRVDYRRRVGRRFGTAGVRFLAAFVGVRFDPGLSEFLAVPRSVAVLLSALPRLGIVPLVPLVQSVAPQHVEISVEVLPRLDGGVSGRWQVGALWHKAIMHLLADPWALLRRASFFVALMIVMLGAYGVAVGVVSVLQGTFLGIGSVILAIALAFAVLSCLMLATLGIAVVAFQCGTGLLGPLVVHEEGRDSNGH